VPVIAHYAQVVIQGKDEAGFTVEVTVADILSENPAKDYTRIIKSKWSKED
jgi:hypothetical protein